LFTHYSFPQKIILLHARNYFIKYLLECVGKEPRAINYEHALCLKILYEHDIISGPLSKSLEGKNTINSMGQELKTH